MSVDVSIEVTIQRPRADVAAFMFEPRNDRVWTTGVVQSRSLTEGPLRTGSQVERVAKFLGRQFAYLYEVIEAEPERLVVMKVEKPFPMNVRYELEDAGAGATLTRIRARGDATGFFRMAAPLMTPMVRKNITADLALLKAHLESPRGA